MAYRRFQFMFGALAGSKIGEQIYMVVRATTGSENRSDQQPANEDVVRIDEVIPRNRSLAAVRRGGIAEEKISYLMAITPTRVTEVG